MTEQQKLLSLSVEDVKHLSYYFDLLASNQRRANIYASTVRKAIGRHRSDNLIRIITSVDDKVNKLQWDVEDVLCDLLLSASPSFRKAGRILKVVYNKHCK